jgi:ABC-type xylose transport system permease subunit
MTAPQANAPTSETARRIHRALVVGVLLFAVVGYFTLRPTDAKQEGLSSLTVSVLLGLSLGISALSLFLRRRIPKRSIDESADLFWRAAGPPAMLVWIPLEAASLLAVFLFARTRSMAAVAVAAVAVILFIMLNPAYLERP